MVTRWQRWIETKFGALVSLILSAFRRNPQPRVVASPNMLLKKYAADFSKMGAQFEEAIQNRFPSLGIDDFPRDVQRELFDRRNRAIHQGVPTFSREERLKCINIAVLVMMLLEHMHLAKAKNLSV